jgi:hypothetical protein
VNKWSPPSGTSGAKAQFSAQEKWQRFGIMTERDEHRSQEKMGCERRRQMSAALPRNRRAAEIRAPRQRPVKDSPRSDAGCFSAPSQVFSGIREILKLVVELAKKDSHFAVLRVSRKSPLQSFEARQ